MKVLWLSHFVPFPPKGGCFQRSYNLLARMGAQHEVHLLALRHKRAVHPESETRDARGALLKHCRSVEIIDISREHHEMWMRFHALAALMTARPLSVAVYECSDLRTRIQQLSASTAFDIVHFDTIGLAQYLEDFPDVPALLTHHGAESHMVKRRIQHEPSLLRRLYCYYEWMSLRAYERKMCPRFAANVVVSDDDARILESIAPSAVFSTVENGVDTDYFTAGLPATSHRLVFAGRLDQYANRHGILTFMKQVWPALRAIHPDVCIDIIGNGPPEALLRMAEDNVRVHGFVGDVRPFFREASVAICPLWDGGGTRLKILDTLAQGTPLVATSIGCEGLDLVHERDALIVDTPAEFTAQISRLFADPALRSVLSANGRKLVERSYSWEAIAPKLASAYAAAAMPTGRLGVPQSTEQAPTGVVTRMVDIRSASGRAPRIDDPPST